MHHLFVGNSSKHLCSLWFFFIRSKYSESERLLNQELSASYRNCIVIFVIFCYCVRSEFWMKSRSNLRIFRRVATWPFHLLQMSLLSRMEHTNRLAEHLLLQTISVFYLWRLCGIKHPNWMLFYNLLMRCVVGFYVDSVGGRRFVIILPIWWRVWCFGCAGRYILDCMSICWVNWR